MVSYHHTHHVWVREEDTGQNTHYQKSGIDLCCGGASISVFSELRYQPGQKKRHGGPKIR